MQTSQEINRLVRIIAGAHASCPVDVIADGASGPKTTGESYYFTTLSGKTRVYSPAAYGWRTRYWPSTISVEVGQLWLAEMRPDEIVVDGTRTVRAVGATRHFGKFTCTPAWAGGKRCMLVYSARHKRSYHAPRNKSVKALTGDDYANAMEQSRAAWAQQDISDAKRRDEMVMLRQVWVSAEHSRQAGNCDAGTRAQEIALRRSLHASGEIGAVRADVLLAVRDDSFTRRAIAAAQSQAA